MGLEVWGWVEQFGFVEKSQEENEKEAGGAGEVVGVGRKSGGNKDGVGGGTTLVGRHGVGLRSGVSVGWGGNLVGDEEKNKEETREVVFEVFVTEE